MAVRHQNGQPFGGGKHRPAYNQEAGSFRSSTNGSGPRNNGWNGRGNSNPRYHNQNHRTHNFIPHQNVHLGGPSQVRNPFRDSRLKITKTFSQNHSQNINFHQANPRRRQNQNGRFPNHASSDNSAPYRTGFQDQLRVSNHPHFIPRGPRNRKWKNYQNQTNLYQAVHDVDMVDASHLDTDIEMPDAPPLESYYPENHINDPALLVAEGIAAANAMLSRIESFVRTGTINPPV
ncbi:hypothetical protein PMG11_06876 [Penicillium brasilianum]|uniref:Uncharacterized protein n=1 Tax=Penicillium brasilianum TaxID=104259 RepID=A0A0F7TRZ9_PENBI|nr:hypothetical protein PMG11_06876 [Penicillium brasilianum]